MPLTKTQAAEIAANANIPKLAFSVSETAAAIGVAPASIYRLVDRGLLKPSRALRCMRFTLDEIRRFLAETN